MKVSDQRIKVAKQQNERLGDTINRMRFVFAYGDSANDRLWRQIIVSRPLSRPRQKHPLKIQDEEG